ncbi:MAG: TSUP family transporter [Segetibacter sp.]
MSGLIGIGGGIIIVPALVYFLGFSQHACTGHFSLGCYLPPVGILAVMNYYKKGFLDIKVVLILAIAFIAGAFLGSKLSINVFRR